MKVGELIAKLQECDPERKVEFHYFEYGDGRDECDVDVSIEIEVGFVFLDDDGIVVIQ